MKVSDELSLFTIYWSRGEAREKASDYDELQSTDKVEFREWTFGTFL